MNSAIIQTGGKQYIVSKGDKLKVEKISHKEGDKAVFDKVLATFSDTDINLGKPYLANATVEAKVLKQGRGKKIVILKYKAKSKYRRKQGHRQHYTEIEITKI